ncbi:major facilitator superfamily domain-containing protein [Emericellopsis atlantica]|uniref:Major facilitator superfamily domain-containing protein n=1 Tax=Emericellopsis atlantica TaxID=2614577 RepID=A0A9P7ZR07_9HYPO|nr:major facilitator superfamily domain-containing protein [Emericellopsis atlantica]KAG9256217.1 major facilitator superfamily domain-containing protein [Emericellopsis atlantica]
MSLAQHVTQAVGFDYEGPAGSHAGDDQDNERQSLLWAPAPQSEAGGEDNNDLNLMSEWRELSYAPLDLKLDEPLERDAAYKVTNTKRIAQVVAGIIVNWLASGIVFGFAALKPVLVAEGVYADLCTSEELIIHHDKAILPCPQQNIRLNLFFVVASITANVGSLLAGATLDRYGRRLCWIMASFLLAVGTLLMACSFAIPDFDGYIAGNVFLALGGTYVFVSSFELANAFPKHSGLVVALVTGAFDASAAVFLFYRMAYEKTDGGFSPARFFFFYLVVPLLILFLELFLMPPHPYHTIPELETKIEKAQDPMRDIHESDEDIEDNNELERVRSIRADKRHAKLDQLEDIVGDADERDERIKVEEERQEASGVWGVLHGMPFNRQMRTPWYLLILALTVTQMFRMNYFIATIQSQYVYMLKDEEAATQINHFFDAALPIGGIAATPFIGIILNRLSVASIAGLLTAFIIAIGALNCLPFVWAGYSTVILFVLFRPLYYSAISDYAAKVFGFASFGRIYGTVVCISGLSNFAQTAIDALVFGPLHGNPVPVNIGLGACGAIVGLALTTYVAIKGRVFHEEKVQVETEERQRLMSVSEAGGYGTTA